GGGCVGCGVFFCTAGRGVRFGGGLVCGRGLDVGGRHPRTGPAELSFPAEVRPQGRGPSMTIYAADLDAVRAAARRIEGRAHRTPVVTCATLDRLAGRELFFKCEHPQKAGAFQFPGACNPVMKLAPEVAARGVVTHSSGNHAGALALAAKFRGIPAHVVMPRNASPVKRRAVEEYGGRVVECEPTLEARERTAADVLRETG